MPPKKVVAIVGSHPLTYRLAPFDRPYIDIWAFNETAGLGMMPRIDAVFQIHQEPIWKNPANRNDKNHFEWLQKEHDFPVFMQDVYSEVPSSVKYPLDAVCEELLPGFTRHVRKNGKVKAYEEPVRYFTSSIAYAIALAIYQQYERIEIYGVEMQTNTEYAHQRDGVTFWTGIALGRGIEVNIPDVSATFNALLYGYEGDVVINRQEFEGKHDQLKKKVADALGNMNRAGEAVRLAAQQIQAATDDRDRDKWSKDYFEKTKAHQKTILEYGVLFGKMDENAMYLAKCDEMYRAVGGEKAIDAMLSARLKEAQESTAPQMNGVKEVM